MVSPQVLPNAVTLNSVAMNMARVFGTALGGVIAAALGLTLCFTFNALSFAAVLPGRAVVPRLTDESAPRDPLHRERRRRAKGKPDE